MFKIWAYCNQLEFFVRQSIFYKSQSIHSLISNSLVNFARGVRNNNSNHAKKAQINTVNALRINCLSVLRSNTVNDSSLVPSDDRRPSEMAILECWVCAYPKYCHDILI